jgi:D-psicose/D-tagatose/L-ribulose 3-epimerase
LKYSISNLSWGKTPLTDVIPKLAIAGVHGVEIAPTAIWPDLDKISDEAVLDLKKYLQGHNLVVSGIQSLLYGHPELQLFNQGCWKDLVKHLENVIRIGGLLGAEVAVFGSPKNRVKGNLEANQADDLAVILLNQLIPCLKENRIVLTLEPNAPDYGADYLMTYEDILQVSNRINSENVKPQIDTGCLWMMNKLPEKAYELQTPHHIHLSTPNLEHVPGHFNFAPLISLMHATNFGGWTVIEMLSNNLNNFEQVLDSIEWLVTLEEEISNAERK